MMVEVGECGFFFILQLLLFSLTLRAAWGLGKWDQNEGHLVPHTMTELVFKKSWILILKEISFGRGKYPNVNSWN